MSKPSYKELLNQVQELQRIVNFKVYPGDLHFEIKDLLYFRLKSDWHFEFLDAEVLELIGYEQAEFLSGRINWLNIVHELDRTIVLNALEKGLKSDKYFFCEFRIATKQGNLKWIRMRGSIFCDEMGRFSSIQGAMNDITSEKHLEMAFESEREIFGWVADSLEDGIYIISEDYHIRFMNKALIDLVGNHVGEVCYQALFDRDEVCPWSVMDAIKHQRCGYQEYHLSKLGKTFQVRSFPIKNRDGSIGKLGQLKDITQTKILKHKVEEFAVRHQAIVEAANLAELGIFIIQDHDGIEARFRYVNEALCRITGYDSKSLERKSIAELVHPDSQQEILERYRQRQRGKPIEHAYELVLVRKDGAPITVLLSAALSAHAGRIATIGFLRDITDGKKIQKSLWISQRLASIGKLAAEIAHEINNPITSVLTFAKLLSKIAHTEPFPTHRVQDVRDFIGHLNAEATRCADIARNLLDFSRQGEIEIKENDIHEILDKTLVILRHRAELNQIQILTSYSKDVPRIFCDFKRLQQAFVNIFWNAIDAMPEGGTLSVSTGFDRHHQMIDINIKDTGIGIPEEDLDGIFEPFFTTKPEIKGVGLGLSVAYGIIKKHLGEIKVSSKKGAGTHFAVLLRTDISKLGKELPLQGKSVA